MEEEVSPSKNHTLLIAGILVVLVLLIVGVVYYVLKLGTSKNQYIPGISDDTVPQSTQSAAVSPAPRTGNLEDFIARNIIIDIGSEPGDLVRNGKFVSIDNGIINIVIDGQEMSLKMVSELMLGCNSDDLNNIDDFNFTNIYHTQVSTAGEISSLLSNGDDLVLVIDDNEAAGSVIVNSSKCPQEPPEFPFSE